jgi:hypothetical protein
VLTKRRSASTFGTGEKSKETRLVKTSCIFMKLVIFALIPSHTRAVKTLLSQLEPLIELVEILEEIQCWWIKIADLYFAIHQTLLTFINSPKLVELLWFKDSRVLVNEIITEKMC